MGQKIIVASLRIKVFSYLRMPKYRLIAVLYVMPRKVRMLDVLSATSNY